MNSVAFAMTTGQAGDFNQFNFVEKSNGTASFICGEQINGSDPTVGFNPLGVDSICITKEFGQYNGQLPAGVIPQVIFRMDDGSHQLFQVTNVTNSLVYFKSGITKYVFFLVGPGNEQMTMKVTRTREGKIQRASGVFYGFGYDIPDFPLDTETVGI